VIQSCAQPSYARIEPGRKVLTREGPIITFELTDKLSKVRGHIRLYAKEALQTFPYFSANGLIVFCVNDAHVCTPMRRDCPRCGSATGVGFGPAFYSKPDRPRSRAPEKCRR